MWLSLSWLGEGGAWHCIGPILSWGWWEGALDVGLGGGRNVRVACIGFWVQGVFVWSRAGPARCEGCPRVNQTGRVLLGRQVCAVGLGAEVPCGPWPSVPFYPDPDDSAFSSAILTHPGPAPYPDHGDVTLGRGRRVVYVKYLPAWRCLFHLPRHPGFPVIGFCPCLSLILLFFF